MINSHNAALHCSPLDPLPQLHCSLHSATPPRRSVLSVLSLHSPQLPLRAATHSFRSPCCALQACRQQTNEEESSGQHTICVEAATDSHRNSIGE